MQKMSLAAQLRRFSIAAAVLSFIIGLLIAIDTATAKAPANSNCLWMLLFLFGVPLVMLVLAASMGSIDKK